MLSLSRPCWDYSHRIVNLYALLFVLLLAVVVENCAKWSFSSSSLHNSGCVCMYRMFSSSNRWVFFFVTVTTCSAGCLLFFATSFLDNSFIFPIKHSTSRRRLFSSGSSSRSRETRLFFFCFIFCCCCCWCFYMLCASNRGQSERDVRMMKKSLKEDYCKWLWLFSF